MSEANVAISEKLLIEIIKNMWLCNFILLDIILQNMLYECKIFFIYRLMEIVAKHLHKEALSLYNNSKADDAELFIKSACNRYYYYIYHLIKNELKNVEANLEEFQHGHKGKNQISRTYAKKIRDKLILNNSNYQNFDDTIKKLTKIYEDFYLLRETVDYRTSPIRFLNQEVAISYCEKGVNKPIKNCNMLNIENWTSDIKIILKILEKYRQQAGYI